MAENNAAQEPQPENQEASAFESPAQSASQPQTSQAVEGTNVAQAPATAVEDKASQKSKLLANLMGGQTASNPALANIMSGLATPNAGFAAQAPPQSNPNLPVMENYVPGRPQYQMINPLSAIMTPPPENAAPKHQLSHNAEVLKEEMFGYVNAIIERMDKAHALKKFETFQIETASRKAFSSLTDHFQTQDKKHAEAVAKVQMIADQAKKRTDTQDSLIKKLQATVQEITTLAKKIQQLEQRTEASNNNITKRFDQINEKITSNKVYLETKIDATNMLEEKFNQNKEDLKQVQDHMLRTKTELQQMTADVKIDMQKQMQKIDAQEARMDQVLNDSKYWLDRYTKAYRENDQMIARLQSEFNGRLETIFYQLSRRVTNDDIKKNFDKYNEMLTIKFRQVEDVRTSLRDVITYQKYFYPLQMQQLMGDTMMNLEAALKDQPFIQYQQRRYDDLLAELEENINKSRKKEDEDLKAHLDELSKKELKTTGWTTTPLDNVEHDFVTPLLNNYLQDLEQRKMDLEGDSEDYCRQLRKAVDVYEAENLVNVQFSKINHLKIEADNKEKELEASRLKAEHDKKVSRTIQNKLEYKKNNAFKRQNSYMPMLDEFGDIDDADQCKQGLKKIRLSIDPTRNRGKINPLIRDCTWYRLDKDLLAASDTQGSIHESGGFRATGGARRTGGAFKPMNMNPLLSGAQAIMDAPPGSKGGEIITTPDGQQFMVLPDGKTMSPLHGNTPIPPGSPVGDKMTPEQMNAMMAQQMQALMAAQGPQEMDPVQRRKLVKEIREEIKPLIAQIADFQIEKANQVIKVQIRKIENEMTVEDQRLHDKIDREIKNTIDKASNELRQVEKEIKENIRSFQRQRARDKSDIDMKLDKQLDDIARHGTKLKEYAMNFEALAIVNSMLIENINMQMEAEMADLLDRRMMSLFGVQHQKVDKIDVQNTTKKLQNLQTFRSPRSPSPRSPDMHDSSMPIIETRKPNISMGSAQNSQLESAEDEKQTIRKEYEHARQLLSETHKLPISIDNKCLMSMQPGRDTSLVLKLFKTACLSYAPNDLEYREHKMSRNQIIGMRRELIEKVTEFMQNSGLHKDGAIYPRRYFDDLIMEQEMMAQQSRRAEQVMSQSMEQHRLEELLQPKLPFGLASGKLTSNYHTNQFLKNQSMSTGVGGSGNNRSQDETGLGTSARPSHNYMPSIIQGKGRNLPGGLTLDTDSELDVSKIQLRHHLANANTARNIRNRTIDVPHVSSDLHAKKPGNYYSNLSKIKSARKAGNKKQSLPNVNIQDTPGGISSKPTLLVENSEEQLIGIDGHHEVSLPRIH